MYRRVISPHAMHVRGAVRSLILGVIVTAFIQLSLLSSAQASGASPPECWPGKIKHDGHTISVSDVWFVASHMGKLVTKVGTLERMEPTVRCRGVLESMG